ncbi:MAG: deoxyribodipyrimidine photo-lyase [Legionella sp.]|nr:deoxyribodipyrimidine photo-lyase [Legionella sp.]
MTIALFWFRQDLRLRDNPAFVTACNEHSLVIPLYILDETTQQLGGASRWWLHHSLQSLAHSLEKAGMRLILRKGNPLEIIEQLIDRHLVGSVYWTRRYEPLAIKRDKEIKAVLTEKGIKVTSANGSLLNEPWTIKNKSGDFFKVFTPYWKHCQQQIKVSQKVVINNWPITPDAETDVLTSWNLLPRNPDWAVEFAHYWQPGEEGAQKKLDEFIEHHLKGYKTSRDFPAENATSRLSPHLHFGEISPWEIWRNLEAAKWDSSCDLQSVERFFTEIGWREFSYYLLYHFPELPISNFNAKFNKFPWHSDDALLKRWQQGTTGYPIVDAGMRELWRTGYMHNRVRMIVASFLTKDLLMDWREGAAWFLDTLVDADLANNSASWQWVAGSGADAAPYFRIFNPVLQSEKFDPKGNYIKQWVPELAKLQGKSIHQPWGVMNYPEPVVDHNEARKRALQYYQSLKSD